MTAALSERDGPVTIVTLNRPERLNAIGGTLLDDLHAALAAAQADAETRAIVLTGAGRAFCAGDDLKEFVDQSASAAAIRETCAKIQRITRDIMLAPKPVIGAVHGYAVGGGFEWMLNCDLVVAADDLICFFPEMALGHFFTGGVTHLLPQMLGHQRAMELLMLGERHGAAALYRLGLVNRVVPPADMLPTAITLAREVSERSSFAVSRLKRVVNERLSGHLATALALEEEAAAECFASDDTARRIASRIAPPTQRRT